MQNSLDYKIFMEIKIMECIQFKELKNKTIDQVLQNYSQINLRKLKQ